MYSIDDVRCYSFAIYFRTGCRPLVEVKVGSQIVLSTSNEYEKMREFSFSDGVMRIPVKPTVLFGDICLTISHARSSLGTKIQGKVNLPCIFNLLYHCQTSSELFPVRT